VHQWRGDRCVGQLRLPGCAVDLGLPDMTPEQAAASGAGTLIIGVVNAGGFIADSWIEAIVAALQAGLDVAAGMHQRLSDNPHIAAAAREYGRQLFDVRHPSRAFSTATGAKRSGKRVLTVGTDCAVGKKYAALALERALIERGANADFRATGQTGILIAGRGVALDAVVADFVAGAAEWLSPAAPDEHWDVIEGQGSLYHPAYAGVTLALIHGSQPDALVICHEPVRERILSVEGYPVPPLDEFIAFNLAAARLTNRHVRAAGISINTLRMSAADADATARRLEQETGLPCCDPIRHGAGKIADYLLREWP
jgi:uncharacterized NAD-dependent epimerase/dehydratase family protein